MSISLPTLGDLETARAELARWEEKWDNYGGNNPNKYRADIRLARSKVESIITSLKVRGLLPDTKLPPTA